MKRPRQDFRKVIELPLVVLAGLPNPISMAVAKATEASGTRVIAHPSGNDGTRLYPESNVSLLMNAVSGFAVRHLKSGSVPPTPKQIILAYVPADDQDRLLAEFEFFVFPISLNLLADYDEGGRQNRHNQSLAVKYVRDSLDVGLHEFAAVKRRLSNVSDREPLFLPPMNFKVSHAEQLADIFREMMRQETPWGDEISSIPRLSVTSDDLRNHVKKGVKKVVLSDVRGLLFPHDPHEHGRERELQPEPSSDERRHLMRSYFRFGVPLRNGLHHDAQFAGRPLRGERFECSHRGPLDLNCSHANIYPNDFVRPAKT
jgi:hypothetical protein